MKKVHQYMIFGFLVAILVAFLLRRTSQQGTTKVQETEIVASEDETRTSSGTEEGINENQSQDLDERFVFLKSNLLRTEVSFFKKENALEEFEELLRICELNPDYVDDLLLSDNEWESLLGARLLVELERSEDEIIQKLSNVSHYRAISTVLGFWYENRKFDAYDKAISALLRNPDSAVLGILRADGSEVLKLFNSSLYRSELPRSFGSLGFGTQPKRMMVDLAKNDIRFLDHLVKAISDPDVQPNLREVAMKEFLEWPPADAVSKLLHILENDDMASNFRWKLAREMSALNFDDVELNYLQLIAEKEASENLRNRYEQTLASSRDDSDSKVNLEIDRLKHKSPESWDYRDCELFLNFVSHERKRNFSGISDDDRVFVERAFEVRLISEVDDNMTADIKYYLNQ